jgi:hypothetical protein
MHKLGLVGVCLIVGGCHLMGSSTPPPATAAPGLTTTTSPEAGAYCSQAEAQLVVTGRDFNIITSENGSQTVDQINALKADGVALQRLVSSDPSANNADPILAAAAKDISVFTAAIHPTLDLNAAIAAARKYAADLRQATIDLTTACASGTVNAANS